MKLEQFASTIKADGSPSLLKQVCLFGGAGVMGSAALLGALPAEANPEVDVDSADQTLVEPDDSPAIAPAETSAESLLTPQVTATPTVESAPSTLLPLVERVVTPTTETPEEAESGEVEEARRIPPVHMESVFIDPTDYTLGATRSPENPALLFSERSTGCQYTVPYGHSTPASSCDTGSYESQQAGLGAGSTAEEDYFSIGPVSIGGGGITVGGTTVISREYFNQKVRPLNLLRRGAEEFVFPLSIPSPITSLFGWRQHPIFGDRRFHTGTDIGAPEGTPVLATKDGEVRTADYLGGYGYTVILHHENGTQETRYAHLSRILVKPGEKVEQGDVVGLVGSTGNSTGPHLHFELRELTAHGWMLVDPDDLMQYTVSQLVNALNNPLQALGLFGNESEDEPTEALLDLPYRPAQPNAS